MRQAQAKLRKQRAKKDCRQRDNTAIATATNVIDGIVTKPVFLGRRELSEGSEQVVKAISSNNGDVEGTSRRTLADSS
eukprot:7062748-Ditylum_brightwellii.AAC.1